MEYIQKAKSIVKKVFSGIMWAILIFLIIVASWLAIDKFVRKSPVPSFMGYAGLTIISGSMSGTMEIDDLIIIKDRKEYKIGDIVTFMKEGDTAPTTHRIVLYTNDGEFITKGDANNSKDAVAVSKDEIFGEVVMVIPNYGKFIRWLKEEGGWLYVGSAALIIVLGIVIMEADNGEVVEETASADGNPPSDSTEPNPEINSENITQSSEDDSSAE